MNDAELVDLVSDRSLVPEAIVHEVSVFFFFVVVSFF